MRQHRLLACTALLACVACSHGGPRGPDGSPLWTEARSEHFVVYANATEEEARADAHTLEVVRVALLDGSPFGAVNPRQRPIRVVLLADRPELHQFLRPTLDGVTVRDLQGEDLLVFSAESTRGDQAALKHELAHALNNAILLTQPRWFSEGLASYLETARIRRDESAATFGELNPARASWFKRGHLPDFQRALLLWGDVYQRSDLELYDFYAQSWLLVHMLVNRHPGQLRAFVDGLTRGERPELAWERAFGRLTPAALKAISAEGVAYARDAEFLISTVQLAKVEGEPVARRLSAAEVHALRAELWSLRLGATDEATAKGRALREATLALADDPGDPLAGRVAVGELPPGDAQRDAIARGVVKARAADSRSWSLLAEALHHKGADEAERLAALEKARALGPGDPWALGALAFYFASHGRSEPAIALAQEADAALPGNARTLDALAFALLAAKRCDEAAVAERRAIDLLPDGVDPAMIASAKKREQSMHEHCGEPVFDVDSPGYDLPPKPPRRDAACKLKGPMLTARQAAVAGDKIQVSYVIGLDGKPSAVEIPIIVAAPVAKALTDFVLGCGYSPAEAHGQKVELRVEELFSFHAN